MILAIVIFAVTYVLMLALPKCRAYVALASAVLFVVLGIISPIKAIMAIDWNVLMMIAGTMGTVYLFIQSKMPERLTDIILEKMPNVKWVIVALALFAGFISAFIDNVATVLMVAPVALTVAKRLNISPVPIIIAVAVSSNLQGAATLVGDTTAIMMAGEAGMDFIDFFFYQGKPSMFWITEIGAVLSALILLWKFRDKKDKVTDVLNTKVTDYVPTILLLGTVILLIGASFITNKPSITNGVICMTMMVIGIVYEGLKSHGLKTEIKKTFAEIDWFTLLLLGSLFMVIEGIKEAGVIDSLADLFIRLSGSNLFIIYTLIVWGSVLISAFVDNIPYVATMLPVVTGIAAMMKIDPTILYFGLLAGATLGGNLTPIGASANITGIGILRKNGYEPSTKDFMSISVPFTLAAVTAAYLLIWLIWK
jgi:Na+/H+ antiporter NhaD/arsenite permease-like protein